MSSSSARPSRRPRRRRRGPLGLLISLAILAIIVVGADRIACRIAERQIADRFQSSQHLSSRPSVTIEGIPFLTQLARRRLTDVRISADGLPLSSSGRTLRITHLDARLRDVRPSSDLFSATPSVTASRATGSLYVSYADLSKAAGVSLSFGQAGRIKASKSAAAAGVTVGASLLAKPVLEGNSIRFTQLSAIVGNVEIPAAALKAVSSQLNQNVPLDGLPAGLHVKNLTVAADGVHADLAGKNLQVS
ncbi:DUF2993 domain-containing protein [Jatrophihabitans telluris]|uniref:DUF2993 domain-containing protein n=1 Tax=Jatrophihabitans telluris TaxID=2038343 RepID=A0ABY4R312_9ACTN|nr:DUF2993 domain-containing protein [Jatrophihabitans telluris]UQX90184.1 DUF2993 domain-containing protein [Jatrophihabitans telluris]